jgi:hypothetical protein
MDKKGHTRYSSGSRWTNTHLPESPSYFYQFMPKKISGADDDDVLASGYTITQTRIALCKCWNGFVVAKQGNDNEGMRMYIGQIRKLQKSLGLKQTEFNDYSPAELANIDKENDEKTLMIRYGTTLGY